MGIIGDGLMRSSTRRAFVKELSKILRDNMLAVMNVGCREVVRLWASFNAKKTLEIISLIFVERGTCLVLGT